MINLVKELGVQSYCFRGFKDNAKVAELAKEIGVGAVELCGVHVNFGDVAQFEPAIAAYRDRGVKLIAIGVQGMNNQPDKEKLFFEFAKRAGAKYMSVDFRLAALPGAFRAAEKLADQYDIYLAIHNHGGGHWLGNREALRWVFSQTSPRIGLCLDTAWALDSRDDPVGIVEEFGARLYGLHIKDFVFDRARRPEDVVVGSGNLDLVKLYAALKKVDFKGYAVLEYEGDVNNPAPALSKCVQAVAAKMAG